MVKQIVDSHAVLFVLSILLGVVARVGVLVGFIFTIKAAIWILKPETVPVVLIERLQPLGIDPNWLMVLVPGCIFLLKAICQSLHTTFSLRLRSSVASRLSIAAARMTLKSQGPEYFSVRANSAQVAADLKTTFVKFFVLQVLLNNTIILTLVFLLSLLVGLILDWVIVGILMSFLLALALFFINHKHQKSLELNANLVAQNERETMAIRALAENLIAETESPDNQRIAGDLHDLVDTVKSTQLSVQEFEAGSQVFLDVAQSVMIASFLFLLIGKGNDSSHLTELALLAVLFRFLISYMQALVQAIVKLNSYYTFLQQQKRTLRINIPKNYRI